METEYIPSLSANLPGLARHGKVYKNANGELHVSLPERLPHVTDDETIHHVCKAGERLQDLAVAYYKDKLEDPVDYWEDIAQFQEDPIIDGSTTLKDKQIVLIPSVAYLQQARHGDSLSEYPRL